MTPLTIGRATLYTGDCREVLAGLAEKSVQCVITSPPYYGLRDYGTAEWDGGEAGCDHMQLRGPHALNAGFNERWGNASGDRKQEEMKQQQFRSACGKCGAVRVDRQIGLEQSPAEYVAALVEVFRHVRRVLRDDGTCWINLGDSYWGGKGQNGTSKALGNAKERGYTQPRGTLVTSFRPQDGKHDTIKPKDLIGIPWRVAFALQEDGWWLRSDIIWSKPNCMPESVADRPTRSHEYLFLLAKAANYYYDADAIREGFSPYSTPSTKGVKGDSVTHPERLRRDLDRVGSGSLGMGNAGRNRRTVWTIPTQSFSGAHFAVMPEKLVEPCVLAGTSPRACEHCGAPWARVVERDHKERTRGNGKYGDGAHGLAPQTDSLPRHLRTDPNKSGWGSGGGETTGWQPTCTCPNNTGTGRSIVLDPFSGSGTVARVAISHGRAAIGIDLNPAYTDLAASRIDGTPLRLELV